MLLWLFEGVCISEAEFKSLLLLHYYETVYGFPQILCVSLTELTEETHVIKLS
jgi:hypothetical protein